MPVLTLIRPISPAPLSTAQTTVEITLKTTIETTNTSVEKPIAGATVDDSVIDHDSDSSTEYSEWEGLETTKVTTRTLTTTSSILKKRDIDTNKLTAKEVKAAKAHYVFLERTDEVLKESLMRASLNAEHAMINGFPEPSIYRDDDDPLGLFDDDDDEEDEDYNDKKSAKKRKVKAKSKKKKKRKV